MTEYPSFCNSPFYIAYCIFFKMIYAEKECNCLNYCI